MTLMVIPLQPIPNQSVSFMLNGSAYTVDVETRLEELYISIWRGGAYVLRNRALRSYAPVGFDLQLVDTEGTEDPEYSGLGLRWRLLGLQR
jgi:hypothetical protein